MREWLEGHFGGDTPEVAELTRTAERVVESHLAQLRDHAWELAGVLSGEKLIEAAWDAERGSLWLRCARGHVTLACQDASAADTVKLLSAGPVTLLVSAAGGNLLVTARQGDRQHTVIGVPATI